MQKHLKWLLFLMAWIKIMGNSTLFAQITAEELVALHAQQIASLGDLEAKSVFEGVPINQDSVRADTSQMVNDTIAKLRNNRQMQDGIRKEATARKIAVGPNLSDLEKFVRDRYDRTLNAELSRENLHAMHRWSKGGIREIQTTDRIGKMIRKVQYGVENELLPNSELDLWTGLETKKVQNRIQVWTKSNIMLEGMVPIGFGHPALGSLHDNEYQTFWNSENPLEDLGETQSENRTYQLFCTRHPHHTETFLIAAFESPVFSCVPAWLLQLSPTGDNSALSKKDIEPFTTFLMECSSALSNRKGLSLPTSLKASPVKISYFEKPTAVRAVPNFPLETRHMIPLVMRDQERAISLRPMHEFKLTITLLPPENKEVLTPVKIVDGMTYLNKDTNQSWIIGMTPPPPLTESFSSSGIRLAILLGAVTLALALFVFFRFLRRS